MNKWYSLLAIMGVLSLAACSTTETVPAPETDPTDTVKVANGDAGQETAPPVIEIQDPTPAEVPRVKQAQIVGVLREMRANGCILKKVASTDGIHYSQLLITCGDPQKVPEVE